MKLHFQKDISSSKTTLPIVSVIALALWWALPACNPSDQWTLFPLHCYSSVANTDFTSPAYGLWQYIPLFLQQGYWSLGLSAVCAIILAVYLMAGLNQTHTLLRVHTQMLSSTLFMLLAFSVLCHRWQPGSVVAIFSLLSFFPLFATYQKPYPVLTFSTYLVLSMASLIFPKLLWMAPAYWCIQIALRSFSLRCFVASLLAIVLPYWFYGGVAVLTSTLPTYVAQIMELGTFQYFNYTMLNKQDALTMLFVILLFAIGSIDFHRHRFLDKTRTRILHNAVMIHGVYTIIIIGVMPQYIHIFLPLLLVDTAIVYGHFFTLTHTLVSHIYNLVLLVLAICVMVAQYINF